MAGGDRHGRHAAHRGLGDAQPSGWPARQPRAGRSSQVNHRLTVTAAAATVLASVALYPLITGTGWFFAGLGAVIVVAAVGTLTRLRPLPAVVCFLAALAGLFLYLNVLFAGPQSFHWLIPTPASAGHLLLMVGMANSETSRFAPPVPLILPGLRHSQRLFPGHGGGGGNGYAGSLSLPDPLVQMNQQLRIPHPEAVLAYHTKDSASPPYLQVYVLGRLGTKDWSLAPP